MTKVKQIANNQFEIDTNDINIITDNQQTFYADTEYKCANGKYQYTISSCTVFQSYNSLVAVIDYVGRKFIDKRFYKYSKTTSKYLSLFFNMTSKEIEKEIKAGNILLCEIFQ